MEHWKKLNNTLKVQYQEYKNFLSEYQNQQAEIESNKETYAQLRQQTEEMIWEKDQNVLRINIALRIFNKLQDLSTQWAH